MRVSCKISPRLIVNISSIYTAIVRVLMEYIDNAIDASERISSLMINLGHAEEFLNDIHITIQFIGRTHWNGKVRITDNCSGMANLSKVVEQIGNSDKKAQPWLNGQFGYGIYSFLAVCETLEIKTKHKDNAFTEYIKISRKDFLVDDLSGLKFEIEHILPHTPISGTEVTLSGFTSESWRDLDVRALKDEIENHFELLLGK